MKIEFRRYKNSNSNLRQKSLDNFYMRNTQKKDHCLSSHQSNGLYVKKRVEYQRFTYKHTKCFRSILCPISISRA